MTEDGLTTVSISTVSNFKALIFNFSILMFNSIYT